MQQFTIAHSYNKGETTTIEQWNVFQLKRLVQECLQRIWAIFHSF